MSIALRQSLPTRGIDSQYCTRNRENWTTAADNPFPDSTWQAPTESYVVGFSGSSGSVAALDEAYARGVKRGATLCVVNVSNVTSMVCASGDSLPALENLIWEARATACRLYGELCDLLGPGDCSWRFYHRQGSITYQICQLASEVGAGLIFVGAPRRFRMITGVSVPQQLLRISNAPFCVVSM